MSTAPDNHEESWTVTVNRRHVHADNNPTPADGAPASPADAPDSGRSAIG